MALPIPFDNPATYDGHSGVDYPQPRGAVIRASGPGTVTTLSSNTRGGFYIWVQYDEGPLVGYHHMDSHAGCPPRWSRVREGTQLGYVGNTGFSTGPHLHSEVSGHASTAGYWRFFDPRRVVGQGGGNITPATGGALTEPEGDIDMKFYYVTDDCDGNGRPGWVLHNVRTNKLHPPLINDGTEAAQKAANGWARSWGAARSVTRQDMLNAIAAVKATS